MKRVLLFGLSLLMVTTMSFAQDRTVSGKVTSSEDGSTLPGVNVVVKGTTQGGVTDMDGNYKITVPEEGGTLVFSFIGLETQEVEIGTRSVIDVQMASDVQQLGEVVVTAIGIAREKKSLGYAVETIKAEDIEQRSEGDIGRILRAQAPGVNVTQTSGVSGSATNIVIRGYTSITGSNQPLFIVDGVPFNGGTNTQQDFVDGQTESSRFLDLDPNNIESMSILKGLSASVLYGEQGRNGVILITTKNGSSSKAKKKTEITISQSYFANKIASLPEYQNNYGGGFYQNFGWFFSNWGPNFNEIDQVDHPYSKFSDDDLKAAFPELQGAQYDYKPYDNTRFFQTGGVATTSINVRGGGENANYNVSYGRNEDNGFTPGNSLTRHNIGFGGTTKLSNKFTAGSTYSFTFSDYETPPIAASLGSGTIGGGSSVFGDVFYTPRNIDLMGLPYTNPLTGGSVYYRGGNDIQNPRWTVENAKVTQKVNRVYGNSFLKFDLNESLNIMYRFGIDNYTEENASYQNKGGVDGPVNGFYRTTSVRNTILNHDLVVSYNTAINDDFALGLIVGGQGRRDTYYRQGVESTNQVVFGVLRHFNFKDQVAISPTVGAIEFQRAENLLGLYLSGELAFREYLFLNVNVRNDWKNTLEQGNNSLLYSGASLAADLTSAISGLQDVSWLNFLKARASFGQSAGFPPVYSTRNTLVLTAVDIVTPDGQVTSNGVSNRLGNPNLTPERLSEIEVGIETQMFNNRFGFDLSLYKKNTKDLIVDQNLDPSTGYTVMRTNAGELEVKGIEIGLNATPLILGDFRWDINANFNSNRNMVLSLPDGTDEIGFTGFTWLGNFAIPGEPYGVIKGSYVQRDDEGNRIVGSDGLYIESVDEKIIGDPNPDWLGAITNSFSWKGVRFSFTFQHVQGGDIYSRTVAALVGRGLTKDTDFDRQRAFILPGVTQEGEENTKLIAATDLYFYNNGFGPDELKVWDATTIRLQDVSLSYSLPASLLNSTPFGSVTFTATGYNLWYRAVNIPKYTNFDTNVLGLGVGNGQGMDFLSGPSSRRFGGSVKLTF